MGRSSTIEMSQMKVPSSKTFVLDNITFAVLAILAGLVVGTYGIYRIETGVFVARHIPKLMFASIAIIAGVGYLVYLYRNRKDEKEAAQ
jgi:hypothetical protein